MSAKSRQPLLSSSSGLVEEMPPISLGDQPGYVYIVKISFLRSRGKTIVAHKIGITNDLRRRLSEIRNSLRDKVSEVTLVASITTQRKEEQVIHEYIKAKHPKGAIKDLGVVFGNNYSQFCDGSFEELSDCRRKYCIHIGICRIYIGKYCIYIGI